MGEKQHVFIQSDDLEKAIAEASQTLIDVAWKEDLQSGALEEALSESDKDSFYRGYACGVTAVIMRIFLGQLQLSMTTATPPTAKETKEPEQEIDHP